MPAATNPLLLETGLPVETMNRDERNGARMALEATLHRADMMSHRATDGRAFTPKQQQEMVAAARAVRATSTPLLISVCPTAGLPHA